MKRNDSEAGMKHGGWLMAEERGIDKVWQNNFLKKLGLSLFSSA